MIETVPETGSTNADLAARLRGGERLAEGHWLIADQQSAGKGRQGRAWLGGAGNFMGSTIVRIGPADPDPASLALLAGLALYETVVGLIAAPGALQLKWPNDLMLRRAKLAGILLEREGETVIVGIGVNLAHAPSLPDRATIALADCGPPPDRDSFARSLAAHFADELERWRRYGLEALLARWLSVAHPQGTPLTVQVPGADPVDGRFAGLGGDGTLRLRLADGTVRAIHAGDVIA